MRNQKRPSYCRTDIKLCYKTIVTQITCHWLKNTHEEHWKKIKDPSIGIHNYSHLTFDKVTKKYTVEKRQHIQSGKAGCLLDIEGVRLTD